MTIQRLPLEIVQKIFKYTDKKEAEQCLYLCKAWYPLLRSIYFEEMTWSRYGLQMLKEKLSKIDETANSVQLMLMTKRLKIHDDVDDDESETDIFDDEGNWIDSMWTSLSTQLTAREFILLLSHFPNLECLDFTQSTHSIHYKKILVNYQGREQLPAVEDFNMKNELNQDATLRKLDFALYYRFLHSLKVMTISYIQDVVDGSDFFKTLPYFTSLRSLDVLNDADPNCTLFHLLRACPNITSLTYSSPLPTSNDVTEKLEGVLRESKEGLLLLKNLEYLNLTLPTITTPYIDFFVDYSPQSLSSIKLLTTGTYMYTWIDNISMDVALKFCESLQKFSSVRMEFTNYNRDRPVDVEAGRASQRENLKIDIFYRILDALTKGRKLNINTVIYNSKAIAGEVFDIVDGLGIMYQYHLNDDYGGFSRLGRKFQDCTLPVPSSSASLNQLAQLEKILFKSGYGEIDCLPTSFLDFIKRYCPELKHFELQPQMIGRRLQATCRDSSKSSLENTTHVILEKAVHSQALLESVNEYFPRVESLSFGIGNIMYIPNAKLEFNLSKFKCLNTFIIDIEEFPVNTSDSVIIELHFTGSKRMVQYLVKKVPVEAGCNGSVYEFQPASISFVQKKIGKVKKQRSYVIRIEGLPQLASIQVKDPYSATSLLNLSHVSSASLDYPSLNAK